MSNNTDWLDQVKWTADGLVPALAQDHSRNDRRSRNEPRKA